MKSLLTILSSFLKTKLRTGVSELYNYILLLGLGIFSLILIDCLFIVWYGSNIGSFSSAIAIVLGFNLILMITVYALKNNSFEFSRISRQNHWDYLQTSHSMPPSELRLKNLISAVHLKEKSGLTYFTNILLLLCAKLFFNEKEDNSLESQVPEIPLPEDSADQNQVQELGIKIINRYLEKRLNRS